MPTFTSALLPNSSGLTFGSAGLRWTAYMQDMDVAGTPTFTGRVGIKNLEDIRFVDQYAGATVGDQIDAAVLDSLGCVVVVPHSMTPGFGIQPGLVLDLRSGFALYQNDYTSPVFDIQSGAIAFNTLASNGLTPNVAGTIRLANTDTIKFLNGAFRRNAMSFSGNTMTLGAGFGVIIPGAVTFSGALAGATTFSCTNQIISTLATGTAPLAITSTTVVPNLNVATLNGVTVSGAPTTGQALVATGATSAAWTSNAGTYKLENIQYTPNTFIGSAGGALFTYSFPANELAVGQALRVKVAGTWLNTTGVTKTFTFTLKAGATTLATATFSVSNASISNTIAWANEFLVICTAAGSAGTVEVQNQFGQTSQSSIITAVGQVANTSTLAFDTTSIQSITLNVAQTNDPAVSCTGRQFMVERLG